MANFIQTFASTYLKAISLYGRTYFTVLPFILALMICRFLLHKTVPMTPAIDMLFFVRLIVDVALTSFFFSFMVIIIYNKFNQQAIAYKVAIKKGLQRCVPVFLAYFMISVPLLLTFLFLKLTHAENVQAVSKLMVYVDVTLLLVMLIVTIIISTYCFVTGVLIANQSASAVGGIVQSYRLVANHWLETFLVLLVIGIISVGLSLIFHKLHLHVVPEIMTLLLSSFYPSLMVAQYDNLAASKA